MVDEFIENDEYSRINLRRHFPRGRVPKFTDSTKSVPSYAPLTPDLDIMIASEQLLTPINCTVIAAGDGLK